MVVDLGYSRQCNPKACHPSSSPPLTGRSSAAMSIGQGPGAATEYRSATRKQCQSAVNVGDDVVVCPFKSPGSSIARSLAAASLSSSFHALPFFVSFFLHSIDTNPTFSSIDGRTERERDREEEQRIKRKEASWTTVQCRRTAMSKPSIISTVLSQFSFLSNATCHRRCELRKGKFA